ncbi:MULTISPECIES: AzlD domain-containing protein [unclassified Butyrivibrio]|uniref:AzlD domain-containing protein n=1 Tax=unclassified Butyrivibrio TaxID=2639466 RepID=UPI0008E51341|nr:MULTISPECIES: AzlD domain-containing protein [unclassified Butyrivibrio]RKM62969.1 AzlD domain-containing protein [Butyrivibrio sp. XB500-5]SFV00666.1 Branched-chain amino acid transport protein (AzlD) [Butyrivibrio sp. INlla21]
MSKVYAYILVMAVVTYAIRALPLTLIRKEIKSKFIKSFLYYVPYATLAAMTFPAILSATDYWMSSVVGFAVAMVLAFNKKSLLTVASCACAAAFIVELFIR